jgi:hypothetical protein
MDKIIEEITKLTEEWYYILGKIGHFKDRDNHWYVETKWSYGFPPKYTVQHCGYIQGDVEEEFDSYENALVGLKNILIEKVKEEKEWLEKDNNDDD